MLFMPKPHESHFALRFAGAAALLCAVPFLAGCPDPQGEFDDFSARYEATKPPPVEAACGTTVQTVEGDFFFALAAKLSPKTPITFKAVVTTEADGMHFSITPLDRMDRKTPIGDVAELGNYPIDADGNFTAAFPEMTIPGDANPITGSPIVATVSLSGAVCEDLICGDVSGTVTSPIMLDLAGGSTFTMVRVEGENYPEPPIINCAGDPANPLN